MKLNKGICGPLIILLTLMLLTPTAAGREVRLSLRESVTMGLEQNPRLQAAHEDLYQSELDVDLAKAARYPDLELTGTHVLMEEEDLPEIDLPPCIPGNQEWLEEIIGEIEPPSELYRTEISLQQPLYTFGRISLGIDQAETFHSATEAEFAEEKDSLIHEIIEAYHGVLLAGETVEIYKLVEEQVGAHKEVVRANLEAGLVTKVDLYEARVRLSKIQQQLLAAENRYHNARQAFKDLLHLPRGTEVQLTNREPAFTTGVDLFRIDDEPALRRMEETITTNNPAYSQLEKRQCAAETGKDLAQAERMPTLALLGDYTWEDEDFGFDDRSWSLMVNLSIDIYDGGETRTEIERAQSQIRQVEHGRSELKERLLTGAESAQRAIDEAEHLIEMNELTITEAEERLRLAELRYKEGVGTSTEVLDAQVELKEARLGHREARYDYTLAVSDLYQVLGRIEDLVYKGG